ncbi:MAG: hypothetical protein Q8M65_06515 [Rhodoglobus sp.]|nr:hypothetical protein [Rhodoglobus sp.]
MDPFEIAQWVLRGALAAIFVGMGVLHFVPGTARGMSAMIPPALKKRVSGVALVRFTGLCEIAGGIGLLVPGIRFVAGVALVIFLIAVFPANAYAAADPERFGRTAIPFWPRYLAQLALIALVLLAIV